MLNKKIVSIILILAMIFSISANSLTVFAENTENQEIAETSEEIESVSDNISDDINAESTEEENTTNTADTLSMSENEITLMSSGVSFAGGSGTEEDPYQVSTPEQLNEVRNNLDKYFIQINDIDMSEATSEGGIYWNDGKGWTPIGTVKKTFSGVYDGRNYNIIGLYCKSSEVSLFGYVGNMVLKNINITADIVGTGDRAAILCSYCYPSGNIENCITNGSVETSSSGSIAGGIAAHGKAITIKNCKNYASIKGTRYVGGIIGVSNYNDDSSIIYCYNLGSIECSDNSYVGGIVAEWSGGKISFCANGGNIVSHNQSSNNYVGGIVGTISDTKSIVQYLSTGNIVQCFNIGDISVDLTSSVQSAVGGIVGLCPGILIKDCFNSGEIVSTVNCGSIVGSGVAYEGWFRNTAGTLSSVSTNSKNLKIVNCYNSKNANNIYGYNRADTSGSTGYQGSSWNYSNKIKVTASNVYSISEDANTSVILLTESEMKEKNNFVGFDFDTIWDISADKNNGYPFLRDMPTMSHTHIWGEWTITQEPTQTETGLAERVCEDDSSHTETVVLPVLTDDTVWTIGAYIAPTCEDTGSQEYISSVYGKVVETIPATGHSWGAWNITKKPTKTETGVAERICGNDSSHKDTATLPVLTDATVWTVGTYVAPTCEDTGSQEYISSTYGTVIETIPAKGHSFTILLHDNEKHWYKCERCNAISNEENHKGGQATKTEKAVCSVCNVPYGKLLPDYVLPTDLRTTYGKALSEILLPTGWNWKDSSIIPTVVNSGYEAYYTIDNDTDYDWTNENGYDASAKQIKLNLTVNVEKANQDISYAVDSVNKYTTDSPFTNVLTKNNIQGTLSFSSSDENVAVVDNNGLVTIKGVGTAVITANVSETDNYKSSAASYTLNVVRRSGHSSGSSTSYTVKFNTNGGTKIENVTVRRNNLLTEPENPTKDGYVFNGWYADEELSNEYDFSSKVTKSFTLYAKWQEKTSSGGSEISEWDNPFKDVHKNDWFYDSVKYVYVNGMMNGVASDLFAPNENITRAMFITVIYRMENEPDVNCDSSFNDVETGSYYEKAVYWGLENGIVKGVSKTEYAPDLNITREQMSAMIYRYANYKNVNLNISENRNLYSYIDYADVSDYAIPAMQYTIERGIIKGMTDNTLEPQGISTRAQAATVFMRTFNLLNVNR